jgi:hypothetical protein
MESLISGIETTPEARPPIGVLRFRRPDRFQMRIVPVSLEETIPPGHHVRVLWEVVHRLDLSGFTQGVKVSEGEAGRSACRRDINIAFVERYNGTDRHQNACKTRGSHSDLVFGVCFGLRVLCFASPGGGAGVGSFAGWLLKTMIPNGGRVTDSVYSNLP